MIKETIIRNKASNVDTFDATFKNVILNNNNVIIPYVNIGVADHPLNESEKLLFINYSYVVCLNVSYLATWLKQGDKGKHYRIIGKEKTKTVYYFGGYNLEEDSVFADLQICCEDVFLQILEMSQLSESIWVPYDGVAIPHQNINNKTTQDFFEGKYMPDNLKKMINSNM